MPLLRPCLGTTLALGLLASTAAAGPPPPHQAAHPVSHSLAHAPLGAALTNVKLVHAHAATPAPGQSVGSPTEGHLVGGSHLGESPYLRIVPAYTAGDARWGLEPLVSMIDRAARAVRKQFPDAVLSVGHLSRPGGGEIDRHASHESGRDADIGFYVRNQVKKPIYAEHFVPFKGDGSAKSWPGAEFDDAKNWALVSMFATDTHARVTHIFVAAPIRARLLSYAEHTGAAPAIRTRAAELMAQPKGSLPHDDHFHVRIACPSGMDKCIEQPLPHRHGHGALAAHRAGTGKGSPERPKAHAGADEHVAASHARTSPPAARGKPERSETDEPADKSESTVPSLAPIVPGLDAAVIPVPLGGGRPSVDEPSAIPPGAQPIDDPDGVL